METSVKSTVCFGEFKLDKTRRLLEKDGASVNLNPKTLELLVVLIENKGEVVSKNDLLDKVWENQYVEENNLTVHVAALRKALGEKKGDHRFIVTVPGRGYSFVAVVEEEEKRSRGVEEFAEIYAVNGEGRRLNNEMQNPPLLIGRTREISEIENLLRGDDCRLLTLTGAGGSGKTSLARTVGGSLAADFADGIFFIELAVVNTPELVVLTIANTLGVKESGERLLIDLLINFLCERRVLLILDNFEQILSAAPILQKLINSTVFLKILVTSRHALEIDAERETVVTPLALPPIDAVSANLIDYAAIELFVRRAQSNRKSFVLTSENAASVADICRRLDGLPLAIELAAARVKLLSPQSILERLEHSLNLLTGGAKDLPERQQTMRDAISWSYELLDEDEKFVFRQLSVFAGGFTVEAAEFVCDLSEPPAVAGGLVASKNPPATAGGSDTILDFLTSLTGNNLLSVIENENGDVRLQMLEVVREFSAECLEKSGEAENIRRSHSEFFLALAEEAEPHLIGENSVEWLEKLEIEIHNIRAALDWSIKQKPETTGRIAGAIRYFWSNHNHLSEGRGWLEKSLAKSVDIPSEVRFKLINALAQFARNQGDLETSRKYNEKGLKEGQNVNDQRQIAVSAHGLAAIHTRQGDFSTAQKFNEEVLEIARRLDDEYLLAATLSALGDLAIAKGETVEARSLIEESLMLSDKLGNKYGSTVNLINLGTVACGEGNYKVAHEHFAKSLLTARKLENKTLISCSLDGYAAVAASFGNSECSAQLAGAADNLREEIGYEIELTEQVFREDYIKKIHHSLDEKSFVAAYQKGHNLDLNEAVALAETSFHGEQFNEIIVETHKFERVIIEEFEDEPKLINEMTVSLNEKSTILTWLKKHFTAAILVLIITALAIGIYVWQRGKTAENPAPFQQISIKRLTTGGNISYAALSPDGKLFAYWEGRPTTLWIGHTSGGEPIELRPSADITYHILRFSSDSNSLYYVVSGKEYPTGALFRIPVLGGVPEKLRENIKTRITFAPGMNQLAYVKNDREKATSTLIIADTDGASEREIISRPLKFEIAFTSPAWSADGKMIAFGAKSEESDGKNYEVFAVSADNGQITQLTRQNFRAVASSAWLDDGNGLVITAGEQPLQDRQLWYVSYPDGAAWQINPDLNNYGSALGVSADGSAILAVQEEYSSNIWIAPADDFTNAKQLTFSALGAKYGRLGLEWTPDNRLIYTAITDKSQTLWTMNADGSNQKKLTPDGFIDLAPGITDDGRVIVFGSNRSGTFEVWRVNADGGNLRQLTFSGGNEMPSVSPDGNWVVYVSTLDGMNKIWRIPLEGGEPIKLSDNAASSVSVSPDSRFVACDFNENDERKLAVLSIEGGAPVKLFDLSPTANLRYALRWMPDGKTITYRDWEHGFWRQSLDGGAAQKIEGLPREKFFASDWSPDGKQFAFTRTPGIRDVVLLKSINK